MTHVDGHGLPISTVSSEAAASYRRGVALAHATWPGAAEAFESAIAADPDFALAHAALARLHAMHARPVEARAGVARAAQLAQANGAAREISHVQTLALAIGGQSGKALASAIAHAEQWPRDTIILSLPLGAFGLFAFSGMADHDQARVDLCERHGAHFADDDWWFLTAYGWALAENGAVGRGRAMLERAFRIRPQNAGCAHALAHAMFEGGANDEAAAMIAGWLPGYDRSGVLHGHIAWHAALAALERDDVGAALAIYSDSVQPSASLGLAINVVSDVASLLWRIEAYGHEAPQGAWETIAAYARRAFPKPGHAFIDAHMALIEAATRDDAAIEHRIRAQEALIASGQLGAGPVAPAISRAAQAFAAGDYAACVGALEPFADDVVRIGGSGAQREVVEDTLLVALMRAGETRKAHELLDRRLHRRSSARDLQWRALLAS